MAVFNKNNTGFETKNYPLFLGEELGLFDTVNLTHPKLEELYQLQLSQIWNEFEVDLTQDAIDMKNASKDTVDLMVKTLSWQHLADSVASKSIAGLLMPYVTNSEVEGLVNIWSFFETIHARSYSHIVKQTFTDANQMLKDTYEDQQVLIRSEAIVSAFNKLDALPKDSSELDKSCAILEALTALFALEAIAFISSFAVTFAITETGFFQGIGQIVKLICRDEVLHTRMGYTILNILRNDSNWDEAFDKSKSNIKNILDSVVDQELSWSDYLFSEGRQVVGLNNTLLKEYVLHSAQPLYTALGIDYRYPQVLENPLPYMKKYINSSGTQAAPQEIQLTAYKVGAVLDDTDDLDLGEF